MKNWSADVRKIIAAGFAILIFAGCLTVIAKAEAKPALNAVMALDRGWNFRQALSKGEKGPGRVDAGEGAG